MIRTIILASLVAASPAPPASSFTGPATVVDGEYIIVGRTHVRLYGIVAPHIDQKCTDAEGRQYACGMLAADVLQEEIAGQNVTCFPFDRDGANRVIAICNVRDNRDLGEQMVSRGYAINYGSGRYPHAEEEARAAKRGMWAGVFTRPDLWKMESVR